MVGITGGPATYARELIGGLARLGGDEIVVFTDRPEAFAALPVETVLVPLRHAWQQVTWDHLALPGLIARAGVVLYHGTKNVLPWRLSVPGVVTVHDLAVYHCPETFAWAQRAHFQLTVPPSVRLARRVIADSAHARADLIVQFGLPPPRVTMVPLAVSPALSVPLLDATVAAWRMQQGLGERLVACVGTIQPRKHVERVIAAFEATGAAALGWQLAIAGRLRPGYRPPWLNALPAGVRFLGPLDDAGLHALYGAAQIAVSASDYEGFGLTVCEAMANGCAVIAVAATSIPEVVGEAGVLVPRSDVALLAPALRRLLDDEGERRALAVQARERAAQFTWDATARGTRAVYEAVLAESGS